MEKIFKNIVGSIAALALMVTFATPSYSDFFVDGVGGLSIGVVGSAAKFTSKGTETEGLEDPSRSEINRGDVSKNVEYGAVFVELSGGTEGGGGAYTVGLEYVPGSATIGTKSREDTNAGATGGTAEADTGTSTGKAEVENWTTFYVEPAYMANDNVGIYAKLGVSYLDINTLESLHTSSTYPNSDAWGGVYGIGLKAKTNFGLFFKLSYEKTEFETIDLESTSGNKNKISAKPELESARLALGFNF
tara:strand:- start:1427 stop:2167 length:741 start_codon:yes stop_codon:yes gene_type:complete